MSALGQKRTLGPLRLMSALPPKADIRQRNCDVRFVPKADVRGRLLDKLRLARDFARRERALSVSRKRSVPPAQNFCTFPNRVLRQLPEALAAR